MKRQFCVLKTLGGCGGTIISRGLAAHGALVLSEVNPRAAPLFGGGLNPLAQMRRQCPELIPEAWRDIDIHTLGVPRLFGQLMADLVDSLDRPLLIRDYSYVDYIGVPFVWPHPASPSLEPALEPYGALRPVLLVRHPAATYRSLLQHGPLANVLSPEDFVAGHISFLASNTGALIIKYERFLDDPDDVMGELCAQFEIQYQPSWRERLGQAPSLTGNERAKQAHAIVRPPQSSRASEAGPLEMIADYPRLLELAGYL